MIAYLSGAMENAVNEGADWRKEISEWLNTNLGHDTIDPVRETQKLVELNGAHDYRNWKTGAPKKFQEFIRKLIVNDLNLIKEKADYVICYWNSDVIKGGGTHGEVTMAFSLGIPVYLINDIGINGLSGWIFACSSEVYENMMQLKAGLINKYGR
jgi:hypothetical protein